MDTKNELNSGLAGYLLIVFGLVWISLVIRWNILRIAGPGAICAGILLRDQLRLQPRKGVSHGPGDSNL